MQTTLIELLKLQETDLLILRLRADIREIPARKERACLRLKDREEAFARAEALWKQESVAVRQLEIEIEAAKDNVRRFRRQQFEVKTNESYRTLLHEIDVAVRAIGEKEDKTLELMERVELHKVAMNDRRREADEERARVDRECAEMDRRLSQLESEATLAERRRQDQAAGIDERWISRYGRILQHVGDAAIVPVDHGTCGGCHMKLPPQIIHDTKRGDAITACTFCGRMLYWHE